MSDLMSLLKDVDWEASFLRFFPAAHEEALEDLAILDLDGPVTVGALAVAKALVEAQDECAVQDQGYREALRELREYMGVNGNG